MNYKLIRKVWFVVIGLAVSLWIYGRGFPVAWQCEGVDELEYLGLAYSLQQGSGYTLHGEPYGYYPPAYPLLLRSLWNESPPPWSIFYALNAGIGWMGMVLCLIWLWRRSATIAAVLLLGSYYHWSFSCRYLMPEGLFFLLTWIVLILVDKLYGRKGVEGSEGGQRPEVRSQRSGSWYRIHQFKFQVSGFKFQVSLLLVGLCLMLATLTKSAALALTGALAVSGLLFVWRGRCRRGWAVLAIAVLFGGGVWGAWEIRSALVVPASSESYLRWMLKFTGVSTEADGVIGRNVGEGIEDGKSSWPNRALTLVEKTGQYVVSMVRPAENARPLFVGIGVMGLMGLMREFRRRPWSPVAWYVILSWLMFSMTTWVSSYTRYIYLIAPAVFLFVCEGFGWWFEEKTRWRRILMGAWGLVMLAWSGMHPPNWPIAGGGEEWFKFGWFWLGVGLALFAVWWAVADERRRGTSFLAWGCVLALLVQNTFLVIQQQRLMRMNCAAKEKGVLDLQQAGRWIAGQIRNRELTRMNANGVEGGVRDVEPCTLNLSPSTVPRIASSLPRMASFLCGMRSAFPRIGNNGKLDFQSLELVLLSGPLHGIPAFNPEHERLLREAVSQAVADGWMEKIFESGQAEVYAVKNSKSEARKSKSEP